MGPKWKNYNCLKFPQNVETKWELLTYNCLKIPQHVGPNGKLQHCLKIPQSPGPTNWNTNSIVLLCLSLEWQNQQQNEQLHTHTHTKKKKNSTHYCLGNWHQVDEKKHKCKNNKTCKHGWTTKWKMDESSTLPSFVGEPLCC